MNFVEQLDPELKAVMERMPTDRTLDLTKISAARARMKKLVLEMLATFPQVEGVSQEDRFAPGTQGDPPVRVRIYRADDQSSKLPALYWIHGGGYVMGDIDMDDRLMKQMVKRIGCVAASVDYRLAPEHPFPTPVEDCYTGLKWLFAHAYELGVEPARIAIGGPSGGGGLTAGLGLLARDRKEMQVAYQLLIYPMIDDRNATAAAHAINGRSPQRPRRASPGRFSCRSCRKHRRTAVPGFGFQLRSCLVCANAGAAACSAGTRSDEYDARNWPSRSTPSPPRSGPPQKTENIAR